MKCIVESLVAKSLLFIFWEHFGFVGLKLIWTSRSLFSDKVLRERTEDREKFGTESLAHAVTYAKQTF